jgi:hypothetical protein
MKLVGAIVVLLILGGCSRHSVGEPKPPSPLKQVPSEAIQSSLQAAADDACRCERSGGAHKACWNTFDQRTKPYGPRDEMAAGMVPVSITNVCFGDITQPKAGFCINTFYMPGHDDLAVCSIEEACALANAFAASEHASTDDRVDESAVTAMARGFAAGARPPHSKECKL